MRCTDFNSRPCERGDFNLFDLILVHFAISIHAPARGATGKLMKKSPSSTIFQFTPLREGRLQNPPAVSQMQYFNSRPCERGDVHKYGKAIVQRISIHAPARGATDDRKGCCIADTISIHAPARGATEMEESQRMLERISIHAPARGATWGTLSRQCSAPISIHAPARGATCADQLIQLLIQNFNSRPCERGDHIHKSQGFAR